MLATLTTTVMRSSCSCSAYTVCVRRSGCYLFLYVFCDICCGQRGLPRVVCSLAVASENSCCEDVVPWHHDRQMQLQCTLSYSCNEAWLSLLLPGCYGAVLCCSLSTLKSTHDDTFDTAYTVL